MFIQLFISSLYVFMIVVSGALAELNNSDMEKYNVFFIATKTCLITTDMDRICMTGEQFQFHKN